MSEDIRRLGDRYELGEVIGRGGMAEVFEGKDMRLGRRVAVKILRPDLARDPSFQARFRREAQSAASLNHPNVVAVYDTGEDVLADAEGATGEIVPYIVMEYVDGMTLRQLMASGRRLLPERALEIASGTLAALDYSHRHGIVHRDIKPANVMLTRGGDVKVMDFGIARVAGSDMTGTGTLLGTFGYMAPEYIKTGVPDPRSDLFAVGVMLYEALAGHRPFEGDTTATILYRLVNEEPAPLAASELRGVSPQTGALLAKALAKDPAHRFQTAGDLARALRDAKSPAWAGLPGVQPTRAMARPSSPTLQTTAPRRGQRLWPAIAVALTLAAGGAGAWTWTHRSPAPRLITLPGPESTPPAPAVPVISLEPAVKAEPKVEPQVESKAEPKPEPAPVRRPPTLAAAKPTSAQLRLSEQEATNLLDEAARGLVDQPQGSLTL